MERKISEFVARLHRISGIPPNLTRLINHFRIPVTSANMPLKVDGFTIRTDNELCIVINRKISPYRQRFTLAHELFHYFTNLEGFFHCDERLANVFAAELLMPEKAVRACYERGWRSIRKYSCYFRVSAHAMSIRLFDELKLPPEEFSK